MVVAFASIWPVVKHGSLGEEVPLLLALVLELLGVDGSVMHVIGRELLKSSIVVVFHIHFCGLCENQ